MCCFQTPLLLPRLQQAKGGFPGGSVGKESTCNVGACLKYRRPGFDPCVGKSSWRRKWQPTPVFLLGKSHGHRSLTDCSQWGHKRVRRQLNHHLLQAEPSVHYLSSLMVSAGPLKAPAGLSLDGDLLSPRCFRSPFSSSLTLLMLMCPVFQCLKLGSFCL